MIAVRAHQVTRTYPGDPPTEALRSASLAVEAAERVAIIGSSGAGKSTLLNILGLLDEPSSGSYELFGRETSTLSRQQRDQLRALHLGFVFQDAHTLGARSCIENVTLKLQILGIARPARAAAAHAALDQVGLAHRAHTPSRLLSGGEKQRLAIARAVVGEPAVLLADEPTGNLDSVNTTRVLAILDRLSATGVTVIVITHDDRISAWADRTLTIQAGVLRGDE